MVATPLTEFCYVQKVTDFLLFLMTGSTSYAHALNSQMLDTNRLQCVISISPALVLASSPWVIEANPSSICHSARLNGRIGEVMTLYSSSEEILQ